MANLVNTAVLLIPALAVSYNWYFTYNYVHVEIDKGTLRGFNSTTWQGAKFFTFKGIPYAKPPIDELRFKGPVEETAWAGVRDAISHGPVCPQLTIPIQFLLGEEDCLFLNVYTPSLGDERLPVMIWIHGGGFVLGSGNDDIHGPDYFMESGVVLVTINYRLGALGFLSTEDDDAPGNAGLKDQVAALRWVRRNIAKFGGDPDNVTIFGESAGGASTHYHLLSPMSKGLFTKAIGQSGSSMNLWSQSVNAAKDTVRLAEALKGKNLAGNSTQALEILKSASYEDIVWTQSTLTIPVEKIMPVPFVFTPSVEKGVESEQVFLSDSPLNILASGNFNKVPYITGYTSHEGYMYWEDMARPEIIKEVFDDSERYVPRDIENKQLRNELVKLIRKFYFDDKPIGNENITNFADLYSDTTFVNGINRATKFQLESSSTPVYFYVFSYDGGLNHLKWFLGVNSPGAAHGDDVGYLFYPKLMFWRKPAIGSEDEQVIDTMIRLWTNFAKYGNPTPAGDPLNWKPATIEKFNYLDISGRDTQLAENPDQERANFWAKAYEKYAALT